MNIFISTLHPPTPILHSWLPFLNDWCPSCFAHGQLINGDGPDDSFSSLRVYVLISSVGPLVLSTPLSQLPCSSTSAFIHRFLHR